MKFQHVIITCLFLSLSATLSSQYDLSGYWEDNFGMHYYVRHIDNTIYWFGEHKDGIWAGAFKGRISGNTQQAVFGSRPIYINGNVYDLPKGKAGTQAELSLKVINGNEMRKNSGPFSATVFRKKTKPRNLPGIRSAGFSSNGLTGLWKSNTGASYYIRQIGNTVVWFGERPENNRIAFSNVAFGTRSGNRINLEWADVPKGRSNGSGNLVLQVNNNQITKVSGQGFGTSRWTKSNKKEIKTDFLNTIVQGLVNQISLNLNNYDPNKTSGSWFKENDAYMQLPSSWGGRQLIDIPQITEKGLINYYYYFIQDVKSVPNGITAQIKPKNNYRIFNRNARAVQKQPLIHIAIRLETEGTEIKGHCTCPSDDKRAPDVHLNRQNDSKHPIVNIYIPLEVINGRISYGEIKTYFDANIQAGGICRIADALCRKIVDYKTIIINEIDKGFKENFNTATVRRNFENSLNSIVPRDARDRLNNLIIEGDNLIFEYN